MEQMSIPPKPENAVWTDDQWKAMTAVGQDILVAAAAGSGKTAVLVERIIRKIIDTENPIDVDELLVVTFTNAAAAEMRHRIGEVLEAAINEHPDSAHLRKQLSLLNRASISTLHSFCQDVIRKYYYVIDLDPGFRIAEDTEAQLIRDEVIANLFEEEYSKTDNDAFFAVVDSFTSDRNDENLETIVLELYDFARSHPDPNQWLQQIIQMYNVEETMHIEELPFIGPVFYHIDLQLEGAKSLLQEAYELTKVPGGPAPRAETYTSDLQLIDGLKSARQVSWETLYDAMQTVKFVRAKTCRGDEFDKELLEEAQKLRDRAKKMIEQVNDDYFLRKPASFLRDMKEMSVHMEVLVHLVQTFSVRFTEEKTERGLVDFADLEHYCLQILTSGFGEGGAHLPSDAAYHYKQRFKEVLVDEYQDTNMVQEAIIQLVTNDQEESGNLFMVGDVKQSIYRFRLAEPNLFLGKYNRFGSLEDEGGLKIDLARNFRSRREILAGTNYIFKQIMGVKVGEIDYNAAAELQYGAAYPEDESFPVEVCLIDQAEPDKKQPPNEQEDGEATFDFDDLEQSQLEARLIAEQINGYINEQKQVYHPKTKSSSPVKYRDIVILLRSMTWAPEIMEELKKHGIPVYANLSTGYFTATEINIMMSLLKVIDNPFQDIPLAAVLRSPIVQLNEEELAHIRLMQKNGSFYEALTMFCNSRPSANDEELLHKVSAFYTQLQQWRAMARQGSLSQLIWQLYRDTRIFDYVGGMPGGKQRQANLTALYDRARQYEKTSFRGLFRFLRFVERMRDRGDDLGAARALGEQEDVVRIMTIHSSKGLEFPVVFVAGLGRQFNLMDLRKPYLFDKDFGVATKYVNAEKQITFPSLPQHAFKAKKKLEMIAEEMRVLYVALTRAKEKLLLVATVKDLEKERQKWVSVLKNQQWLLSEFDRSEAVSFLDWIGPALMRHHDCDQLRESENMLLPEEIVHHPSNWKVTIKKSEQLALFTNSRENDVKEVIQQIKNNEVVPIRSNYFDQVMERLSWTYQFQDAASHRSKQSVSEVKRQHELKDADSGTDLIGKIRRPLVNRPRFMQEKSLTPAEQGTAMHTAMQHIPLNEQPNEISVALFLEEMVTKELLTIEQCEAIEPMRIVQFFETDIGNRLLRAQNVKREVPFSIALPADEVYPDWQSTNEPVFIQGMIDCLFDDDQGLVLLDYKTDRITDRFAGGFGQAQSILMDRYRVQIDLYTKAIEQIFQRKATEKYLYFFDGAHLLMM